MWTVTAGSRMAAREKSIFAAAVAACLVAACGGAEQEPSALFPTDFRPGPALGDPPAPDPRADGSDYLLVVAPRFVGPWRAFLDDLRLRLPPAHALNQDNLSVRLHLELDPEGDLVAMRVLAPSGNPAFDEAALEVAGEAVPLPRPPPELLSDDERLHVEWQFSRDQRQAGPATASVRRIEWPLERAVPQLLARGRIGEAARRVAAAAERSGPSTDQAALVARFRDVCAAVVIQALTSDDSARQATGIAAAVAARLTPAAPALRRLARGSIDPGVRRAALRALGQLGDRGSISLLRQAALGEAGAEASGSAAAALSDLGADAEVRAAALARLRSTSELERWSALAIMTEVPVTEAEPDLSQILRGSGGVARAERITAASALGVLAARGGEAGSAALASLTDCLSVADAAQRAACAEAIAAAASADGGPVPPRLYALLRDRDESVRAAATLAAARLDPARFAARLAGLRRDRSELVQVALATGLAGVPGPRALDHLVRQTASGSPAVRLAAARSLAARTEPRAAEVMTRLAGHRDLAVRVVAVRAERRPEVLRESLRDDAPEVRAAALAALVALEGAWPHLVEAAELVAELPPASVERTLAARAWLAP
jgi:TonB family protein